LQAARAHHIPTAIYQHGSTARLDAIMWWAFLANADKLIVYGEGTAKTLRTNLVDTGFQPSAIIVAGSSRLDHLQKNAHSTAIKNPRSDRNLRVLYVSTFLEGYGYLFPSLAGYEAVEYFELQQRIMKIFSGFPKIELWYKDISAINSLPNPLPDFIQRNVPNAHVIRNRPLIDFLRQADLVIVDQIGTALGEALLTSAPLIVYAPGKDHEVPGLPQDRLLLARRATVCETAPMFEQKIREFLTQGDFTPISNPDSEFLKAYGTHLNDGYSARRAAAALMGETRG
jgi:hypothetical protein